MGFLDQWDERNQRRADAERAASKQASSELGRWRREVATPEGDQLVVVAMPAAELLRPPLPYVPLLAPWNLLGLLAWQIGVPIRRRFMSGWRVAVLTTVEGDYSMKRQRVLHVENQPDDATAERRLDAIATEIREGLLGTDGALPG